MRLITEPLVWIGVVFGVFFCWLWIVITGREVTRPEDEVDDDI